MKLIKGLVLALLAAAALLVLAGQFGLLGGQVPADLGVRDGRLKAPSLTPNSVSSQARLWSDHARAQEAQIEALPLRGDGPATIARLRTLLQAQSGVLLQDKPDYLHAQCTSRWLKFSDDLELWFDPAAQVVQVRSASRLGRRDMGVNRARVEALRAALAAAP